MAIGKAVIVMLAVAVCTAHPPAAAIVFVTIYVPGALKLKFKSPVAEFIDNPTIELNVPEIPPPE